MRKGASKSCGCYRKEFGKDAARRNLNGFCGPKHPRWGSYRKKTKTGYILLRMPDHPNSNKTGTVSEHTVVMSKHLGRPLMPGESVHHKNGVRDDNRIENLELWSRRQPSGQRVSDKLEWAKEIIRTYEPVPASSLEFLMSRPEHELRVGA